MKKLLILIAFIVSVKSYAQEAVMHSSYGYKASGVYDTVKVVLLVTACDTCSAKAMKAVAVREKFTYFGDAFFIDPTSNSYPEDWQVKKFLDKRFKPIVLPVRIWNSKIME